MKIIAIVGHGNSGKSTTVRHLTGVSRTNLVGLEKTNGEIATTYVRNQAPQEPPEKILPQALVEILEEQQHADYAILTFRINGVQSHKGEGHHAPGFLDYLTALSNAGHTVEFLIHLSVNSSEMLNHQMAYRIERNGMHSNAIAGLIRQHIRFK